MAQTQAQKIDSLLTDHQLRTETSRDKYGRGNWTVVVKDRSRTAEGRFILSVVVTMPKTYTEKYPDQKFLVNDWSAGPHEGITYHSSRFAAKMQAIANVIEAKNRRNGVSQFDRAPLSA